MSCATRGPAHKLCRSLQMARARREYTRTPPLPPPPQSAKLIAHRSPDPEDQQEREFPTPQPFPHTTMHREASPLTPDREGEEGNTLARLPSTLPHNTTKHRTPTPTQILQCIAKLCRSLPISIEGNTLANAPTAAPPEGRRCGGRGTTSRTVGHK